MERDDFTKVLHDSAAATQRAARIGFDVGELLMVHGYLINGFLSP